MQIQALLTLLPLLGSLVVAAPTCNRPSGHRGGGGRRPHTGTRTRTRTRSIKAGPTGGVVPDVGTGDSTVSISASSASTVEPVPTLSESSATTTSVFPMPSIIPDVEGSASSSAAIGGGPVNEGGAGNLPSSIAPSPVAPTTTSRAAPTTTPVVAGTTTTNSAAVTVPSSSSAAAGAPPAVPSSGATGSSPIGLAMNYESKANVPSFGGDIGWYYSWNLDPLPNTQGLEFVPMVWGADMSQSFSGTLREGATHVLGFNEPDIGNQYGGSNLPAARAADLHKQWTGKVASGIKIGSPAVARGGKKWMQDWLAACGGGCKFDFVPYHYYGTDASDLIEYTKDFYNTFNKPLWLTEVACHDYGTGTVCNADQVRSFMKTFFDWANSAEGKLMVERWSWFGVFPNHAASNANGLLNADGTANEMGKYYASF